MVSNSYGQQSYTLTKHELDALPVDVKAKIIEAQAQKELDAKITSYGKWVGIGKEVGVAVNESLGALTSTADDFSKTNVGKFTMVLVAYKVLGTDMIQLIFGVMWVCLIVFLSLFVHYKYGKDKRLLVSKKYNSETKKYEKEWEVVEGVNDYRIASIIIFIVGLLITNVILFA